MRYHLFNADVYQALPGIKNKAFNLCLADPPYGIKESSKNHQGRNTPIKQKNGSILRAPAVDYGRFDWDHETPPTAFFEEIKRVSDIQLIFGANYFESIAGTAFKSPRRPQFEEFIAGNPYHWIIWDKVNGTNDFNDCELIWCSHPIESYILPFMWNGMLQGKSITEGKIAQGNKKLQQKRIHPTEKPILLYQFLIGQMLNFIPASHKSLKIIDTHLGSGSSILGARRTGLDIDFTGYEKNSIILHKAETRANTTFAQGTIL
jgi:site-specific DNA-methyltransferase (adenine-specific)